MKKLMLSLSLFFLTLLILYTVEVSAENELFLPEGVILMDDQGIEVSKNGNYFFKLKDLFPGDYIYSELVIDNQKDDSVDLEMTIQPLKELGPVQLIKEISMTLIYRDEVIYKGNLVSEEEGETKVGSIVSFGRIQPNGKEAIKIELHVNPHIPFEDIRAAESVASVRWHFNGTTIPDNPKKIPAPPVTTDSTTPKPTTRPDPNSDRVKGKGILPQLGQNEKKKLMVLSGIMIVITGIVYLVLFKDKQDNHRKGT